jgi:NAD(P)H-dependent flavin oxidoreductase YrpB (nitropropane dioxygenase family)
METPFTRLLGCRLPLQQAGMGGVTTVELAVAVANSGALGMLGAARQPPPAISDALDAVADRTDGVVGVNFLMPFLDLEAVEVASGQAKLVEFFHGRPDPSLVSRVHQGGALAGWQAGSLDEARAAADAGVDIVIVQGVEAGGHVRGQLALLPLLDMVLDAVELPVLAAGGIGSARSVATAIAAGAAGVRVGTRFLAAEEADVHPAYLEALVAARAEDTVVTTTFSMFWGDAPHRVLAGCVDAVAALDDEIAGEVTLAPGMTVPVPRLSPQPPTRTTAGHVEAMAQYAGQSVNWVRRSQPAAEIVADLCALL